MQLLATGLTREEVAEAMAISEHTVRGALTTVFNKLTVNNIASAVAEGFRKGLLK